MKNLIVLGILATIAYKYAKKHGYLDNTSRSRKIVEKITDAAANA